MAADEGNIVVVGADDRISDLPDDLLHRILICLPTTADGARTTSVLSRRWRRVWTHVPELTFRYCSSPDAAERVDAALAASSAPVLHRLEIALPPPPEPEPDSCDHHATQHNVTEERVRSWLRFAAERLAGELCLSLPLRGELVLPVCGRFTAISIASLDPVFDGILRLRGPAGGGVFTALAALTIKGGARMEGRELEEVVCSSRPSLKELVLDNIILDMNRDQEHNHNHILAIRSNSLQKLQVAYPYTIRQLEQSRQLQLQVDTPELQELSLYLWGDVTDAHIAAPKLSKFCWRNTYDPRRHKLVVLAGRHLKRLELTSQSLGLLGRFHAVDELCLDIFLSQGAQGYRRILKETNKIIKCEALVVTFSAMLHAFQPILLHLLRKFVGIRKLVVRLSGSPYLCKVTGCPCKLGHDRLTTNDIVLDSLQEIVVEQDGDANQIVKLVSLFCGCSETFQKKVHITVSSKGNDNSSFSTRRKIDTLLASDPNDKVEVTIR